MKDNYQKILHQIKTPKPDVDLADKIIKASVNIKQQHIKPSGSLSIFFKLGFASLSALAIGLFFLMQNNNPESITTPAEIANDFYIYNMPTEEELDIVEFESYLDYS